MIELITYLADSNNSHHRVVEIRANMSHQVYKLNKIKRGSKRWNR